MLLEVDREATLGSKALLTALMGAAEWFVFGIPLPSEVGVLMRSHVLGQVPTLPERLATTGHFTLKWSLTRVDPDVLGKIRGLVVARDKQHT